MAGVRTNEVLLRAQGRRAYLLQDWVVQREAGRGARSCWGLEMGVHHGLESSAAATATDRELAPPITACFSRSGGRIPIPAGRGHRPRRCMASGGEPVRHGNL